MLKRNDPKIIGNPQLRAQRSEVARVMVGVEVQNGAKTNTAKLLRVAASAVGSVGVTVESRYIVGIEIIA